MILRDIFTMLVGAHPLLRGIFMAQTVITRATVTTSRASRFGKQLTNHLGRKAGGEWDSEKQTGWVNLLEHRATFTAVENALELEATVPDEKLDLIEDVIGRHLVRFMRDPEVIVSWVRSDESVGSVQQYEEESE